MRRAKIGIVTGSGPEAGMDLWAKVLLANRLQMGERYRGDVDAPEVTVRSIPELGLSMALDKHRTRLRSCLIGVVLELGATTDYIAIACNTLHVFEKDIRTLSLRAKFISVVDVTLEFVEKERVTELALVGSSHTLHGGRFGVYGRLFVNRAVELPRNRAAVDRLILDIKEFRLPVAELRDRFQHIVTGLGARTVLLACTDLPLLLPMNVGDRNCVDVTKLLATRLAELSLLAQPTSSVSNVAVEKRHRSVRVAMKGANTP